MASDLYRYASYWYASALKLVADARASLVEFNEQEGQANNALAEFVARAEVDPTSFDQGLVHFGPIADLLDFNERQHCSPTLKPGGLQRGLDH